MDGMESWERKTEEEEEVVTEGVGEQNRRYTRGIHAL